MEDLEFNVGSLLSDEEAEKIFNDIQEESSNQADKPEEVEKVPAEENEVDQTETPERVGEEEDKAKGKEDAASQGDGTSPNVFYSSIANALKNDGIFPDFDDDTINAVKTPDDFAELFEKAVNARLDEAQKRINEALGNGVQPDTIRMYEQTIQYLDSIDDNALSAEGEEGENLRKQLIYNDLINRGYSQERANREIEKSFNAGTDVEDAKDALAGLNKFYKDGYQKVQDESKAKTEAARKEQKKNADAFKKMILEDDVKLGEISLDKRTRQKVFDAVSKPVYKDPDTGQLLTAVQRFQKEKPLEFLKQLGMWYVLTDGGKSANGFVKDQVRAEKNKSIRELERKINASTINPDGSLHFASGVSDNGDSLLNDGWKIDI